MSYRFLVGCAILLLVDILWVASSEITEFLYHDLKFNKPFFIAYIKSTMFSIYLCGFFIFDSWWTFGMIRSPRNRNYSLYEDEDDELESDTEQYRNSSSRAVQHQISLSKDEPNMVPTLESSKLNGTCGSVVSDSSKEGAQKPEMIKSDYLSEPAWVPIKKTNSCSSIDTWSLR